MMVDESGKAEVLFDFFNDILGTPYQRQRVINLDMLDLLQLNLSELSERFTEEGVGAGRVHGPFSSGSMGDDQAEGDASL
jgi:hypothetical protein